MASFDIELRSYNKSRRDIKKADPFRLVVGLCVSNLT
jgi:hypothetical protein